MHEVIFEEGQPRAVIDFINNLQGGNIQIRPEAMSFVDPETNGHQKVGRAPGT